MNILVGVIVRTTLDTTSIPFVVLTNNFRLSDILPMPSLFVAVSSRNKYIFGHSSYRRIVVFSFLLCSDSFSSYSYFLFYLSHFSFTTIKQNTFHINNYTMTIQAQYKPSLFRADSCSSAEIRKSLVTKASFTTNQQRMPTIRPRRQITFNEQVVVRTIEHVNDKDDQEIANTWYKKAEYQMMRASFAVTVRKILNGQYRGDCEHHCARGLEFRSPGGAQRRRMNKLNSLVAVLDEQERQHEEDDENSEALACVYVHSNHSCRHEASQRGELDAEEALRMHDGSESLTTLLFNRTFDQQESTERQPLKGIVGKKIGNIFKRKEKRDARQSRQ